MDKWQGGKSGALGRMCQDFGVDVPERDDRPSEINSEGVSDFASSQHGTSWGAGLFVLLIVAVAFGGAGLALWALVSSL